MARPTSVLAERYCRSYTWVAESPVLELTAYIDKRIALNAIVHGAGVASNHRQRSTRRGVGSLAADGHVVQGVGTYTNTGSVLDA
jgi:hypothetical protein